MLHETNYKLRSWELALLLAVAGLLLAGSWLSGQQAALSERVVRLHVIAASDSPEDQAMKLRVRDAVLEAAGPWLEGLDSQGEARQVLSEHLEELAQAGAAATGYTATVTAQMADDVWFPTKEYEDFSLPAGHYTALRITLDEGGGQNWWCVVFPPLCLGSVTETVAEEAGNFSDDQVKLVTGESEGYVVRFKALELWNELTRSLG